MPILGSDYRGSLAGLTFSKGQWPGVVCRRKVGPINPNTTLQSSARSAFSAACQSWNELSDADRQAWHEYAQTCIYTNSMDDYSVGGRQMFLAAMQITFYLDNQGEDIQDVLPTPPVIPGFLDVANVVPCDHVFPGATGIALRFESIGAEAIVGYAIRSFGFNPARNRLKSPFMAHTLESAEIAAPGLGVIGYEGLEEDLVYFTKFRAITAYAPHRFSATYYLRHVPNVVL